MLEATSNPDKPSGNPRMEEAEARIKVGSFLQFVKQVDAARGSDVLIGPVIDKLYFQEVKPLAQSRISKLFRRPLGDQVDMSAFRQKTLTEALQQGSSYAKIALLKEVMPCFESLGGGDLVQNFARVIDYDFSTGEPRQEEREELTKEQAHVKVGGLLQAIKETDAQKREVSGRGLVPDISVAVDAALRNFPNLRGDLDYLLQRQGLSAMKAQLLMKIMPRYSPHVKGGIDSDLAKIIDYKPSSQ